MIFTHLDSQAIELHIKPFLEIRERYERKIDRDFQRNSRDNRSDFLTRIRVGANLKMGKLSGKLTYQYSHNLAQTPARNFSTERSDLAEAYIKAGAWTFGRQRIAIGSQRVVGESQWHNVSQSFDGVRFEAGRDTAFAFRQGTLPTPSKRLFFAGAARKDQTGVSMLLYKSDRGKQRFTLAREGAIKVVQNVTLEYIGAVQAGSESGKQVRAWAGYARATRAIQPRLDGFVEINAASGGRSGGTIRTYDQGFATGHDRLGLLDTTGWQNILQFGFGLKAKLGAKDTLKFQAHHLQLLDAKDAWYGVGGGANARVGGTYLDATGAAGKQVGHEWDLDYQRKMDANTTLQVGVGIFAPGRFVKTLQAGPHRHHVFGYIQFSKRF